VNKKVVARGRRHERIRKRVQGNSDRPRLSVFRSARHFYAQVIDDTRGATLVQASTVDKDLRELQGKGGNTEAARRVGTLIAERAGAKGISKVVMDRGGFLYHGRVKAFADAAREGGLEF